MGERRGSPRAQMAVGEAARREAASLLASADQRMSKVRPGCVSAMPQSMRSRSKRQTHFDRLVEDGAQGALRPSCPTDEAINPNARPVSSDGSDQLQSLNGCPEGEGLITSTAGLDRGRRTSVNSVVSIRAACEGPTSNSASAAFPRGRPGESESSSGRTRATGITHPGFYGRKPWKKPNSEVIITGPAPR